MDVGELLWPHPRERADGVVRGVGGVGDGLGTRGILEDFDTVTGLVRAAGGKEIMLLCVGVGVGARACMETNRM